MPLVHSSDAIRKELYGDENDQSHNQKVFDTLHKRIRDNLQNGFSVVYDATNLNRKRRQHFLRSLSNMNCNRICIVMAIPYHACLLFNEARSRKVPEDAMWKMYLSFQPPSRSEGFDEVYIYWKNDLIKDMSLDDFTRRATGFDQKNQHHNQDLLDHSVSAMFHVRSKIPSNFSLALAALLHDNGKLLTQTDVNARGIRDGDCHYYGHENVGAYNSILILKHDYPALQDDDVLYIANLISYHMRPYTAWKSSEKAYKNDLEMCGLAFIKDVELLHEADIMSH